MSNRQTILDTLVVQLTEAGLYNRNDQVAPAAVLWPDEQRQWDPFIPLLREHLPLLTLGEYDPVNRTGPSYWIRCMVARTLPEDIIPGDRVPIIYLPGYGKQDLRAIEECPKTLQPLAELQYRGTLWVHRNGRDWTVIGFLNSLDISVAGDNETKDALARALTKVAREPVERLRKQAPLNAEFFNELLHPDAVRQILLWMSDPQAFQEQNTTAEWDAFLAICQAKFNVEPVKDGPISVAQRLSSNNSEWVTVWQRYLEAPEAYPGVPDLLRHAQPKQLSLFEPSPIWPHYTELAEERLREELTLLREKLPDDVRSAISSLEKEHGPRRDWVWAKLGQAPLASVLQPLNTLATLTKQPLGGVDVATIVKNYTSWGWQVDAAVMEALALVENYEDVEATKNAILPLYLPWLQQAATIMQQAAVEKDYDSGKPIQVENGTCVIFSDALRYDVAQRLTNLLEKRGLNCDVGLHLAALPTVTSTAKPAISPVADHFQGKDEPSLTPVTKTTKTSLNANMLRNIIQNNGWQILQVDGNDLGDPSGRAWLETGAIDQYGHEHGWKIAHHVLSEVKALADRVRSLLDHGWNRVVIVTDHGWLMLPDGLPKVDLPIHVTKMRKGRCAVLKVGASTDQPVIPWHWNPNVRIAIARGIHCFEAGKEYEHGGVSPQECIVPVITVETSKDVETIAIQDVKWRGLRCYVELAGASEQMKVDIRLKAGDAGTSIVMESKQPDANGQVALIVPNEEHEASAAFIVVIANETLRAQQVTIVGGV